MTVVIVTFQSQDVLPGCLKTLPQGLQGVEHWEVVVADNASTDETLRVAAEAMPKAALVNLGANKGYAAGINAGIAAGHRPDAILVMNPDVRLRRGSIRILLDTLETSGTGIAVPKIVGPDGRLEHSLRREPSVLRALGEALLGGDRAGRIPFLGEVISGPGHYQRPATAAWATGAVMLVSRRCLDALGGWDESFFLYSEETEFCLRAAESGFALRYHPGAVALHLGGESGVRPHLWRLLTVNRVKLYRRRHGRLRSAAFWSAVVLNEALRAMRSSTHRAALRALLGGSRDNSSAELPAGGTRRELS